MLRHMSCSNRGSALRRRAPVRGCRSDNEYNLPRPRTRAVRADPIVAYVVSAGGPIRPVYEQWNGRQYVLDDDGEPDFMATLTPLLHDAGGAQQLRDAPHRT
jgi:hypothetical protein